MRLAVTCLVVVFLELLQTAVVSTQSPDLEALRVRVGAAVRRFVSEFRNVVTEEEYEQRFAVGTRRRRLKSDYLLVSYPGSQDVLMVFRDVREVDGKPVRDKDERITKLFCSRSTVRSAGPGIFTATG
jgi:hypothetical protein